MTSIYNKIHRLKGQDGWTWDHFLGEVDRIYPAGMDEKTLYNHYRLPHKKANSHLSKIINLLHTQCFPDPFPEDINRLMRLYNHLQACKRHLEKDRDIKDLEYFLQVQLQRQDPHEYLRVARLHWLAGNIHFDRIATCRDNGMAAQLKAARRQAIEHYQQSVQAIKEHNHCEKPPVMAHHLYKARHNILACYLNAVPQQRRGADAEVIRYLQESDFIANSKQTLEEEPFQWSIARNGLRFSSLLKNAEDVEYFFRALIAVSERFLDLDYEPLNCGSIRAGKDFDWACGQILTPDFLHSIKQKENLLRA